MPYFLSYTIVIFRSNHRPMESLWGLQTFVMLMTQQRTPLRFRRAKPKPIIQLRFHPSKLKINCFSCHHKSLQSGPGSIYFLFKINKPSEHMITSVRKAPRWFWEKILWASPWQPINDLMIAFRWKTCNYIHSCEAEYKGEAKRWEFNR